MGVSQLLGARARAAPPQVYAYAYSNIVYYTSPWESFKVTDLTVR